MSSELDLRISVFLVFCISGTEMVFIAARAPESLDDFVFYMNSLNLLLPGDGGTK